MKKINTHPCPFLFLFFIGFVALMGTLSVSPNVHADDLALRDSPRLGQGIRPAGMGGAFVALSGTDENAIFYNPAAINDYEEKIHMQFLLPTVDFSYKAIPFFANDITSLADDIDDAANDSARVNVFDAFAQANTGRYEEIGVRGPVAILMHKYITATLFYENRSVLGLLNRSVNEIEVESVSHGGLIVGSAYGFFDGMLQIGGNLKFLVRHLIDETITSRDVQINNNLGDTINFNNVGFGIGADIGIKGKLPIHGKVWEYLDPSFALTLQDIGHTRFFAGDDVGKIKESLTFGLVVHPDFWKLKSNLAMDFRDLDRRTDFLNKFHIGYELIWPEIGKVLREAAVRVGVNQGYIGGGFGLDFQYFKLNFATYGRETGKTTRQRESRIFGIQLAAGF